MAYWGEALTFAQLLWGLDYADSARTALTKLGPTTEARLAKAGSARERQYGAAVEALFAPSDLPTRVRGCIAGLRTLTSAYPHDLEARALLAGVTAAERERHNRGTARDVSGASRTEATLAVNWHSADRERGR